MKQATSGDTVRVHYTGTLDDGSEFDSSAGREPLEFTLGSGQVIPGFDNAVTGMAVGDTKTVTMGPDEAYGTSDPDLVQVVDRDRVPPDIDLEIGMLLSAGGQRLQVTAFDDDSVTLDANHPLADKALTFALELVAVVD